MEEIEIPIEGAQEKIHEAAENEKEIWFSRVALFSALVAVVAAISGLMAGHHSNEAMIAQIKASDSWTYYQAKGVKAAILNSKMEMLRELGKSDKEDDVKKVEQYKDDQEKASDKAKEMEADSVKNLNTHEILAKAVTLFQVAIAIAAVSVLTRKRHFWWVSMGFAFIGVGFFIQGLFF